MQYRNLGRNGLRVGEIGLGTEYLNGLPGPAVGEIVGAALERGVNYFDVVYAFPEYRDNLAAALRGKRDQIVLPGHLGSGYRGQQYRRIRTLPECERLFHDQLTRFETDHVDVLLLHNINNLTEYRQLLGPRGLLELACRLQREGKVRSIGMSCHDVAAALQAVNDGVIDVLMFPASIASHAQPGRKELFSTCASLGVGVVVMKPFAGGKLFQARQTVYVPGFLTGGQATRRKIAPALTPVQCLSYVLAQPAVATAVPGVKNSEELAALLAYLDAAPAGRDFAGALAAFPDYVTQECVYCNHCLPCPEQIDVGQIGRLLDLALSGAEEVARSDYASLAVKASACRERSKPGSCGACVPRCPFGVDVPGALARAVALFEV